MPTTTAIDSNTFLTFALVGILCILCVVSVFGAILYTTPHQQPKPPATHTTPRTISHSVLLQQTLPLPTHPPALQPQLHDHDTHNTLPSYVESRSVRWTTNTNVEASPHKQTNNHQPFSTQHRKHAVLPPHTPPTGQPRVHLWNSSLCGMYV